MDYQLNGRLRCYGLVMTLLVVMWRPVFPSSLMNCKNTLERTEKLTAQLKLEATQLLEKYEELHNISEDYIPGNILDEVPDATILGTNTSEKLQNIYTKEVLFHWHLSKVADYHKHVRVTSSAAEVGELLKKTKSGLSNHFLTLKHLLSLLSPGLPLPTEAPPLELSRHDFAKKYYGWGVIYNLKDLIKKVLEELIQTNVCVDV